MRTSPARARALEEQGRRGARTLANLVRDPEKFLAPLLLLVLISQLVAATLVGVEASRLFGAIGVIVATLFEIVVFFVLAEAIPKQWAVLNTDRAALLAAPVISAVISFPPIRAISWTLIGIARFALSLFHSHTAQHDPAVAESELLALADAAVEADVIEHDERALISSILEFSDSVVREVMAPRTDIVAVEAAKTTGEVLELAIVAGLSRIPVFERTVDDIVAIAYSRDLIHAVREGSEHRPVLEVSRQAHYVPETKRLASLLREMQAEQFHLAVVVDEYGSTAGIVTLEDLIEELVGEISDEFDADDPLVEPVGESEYLISARMAVDEVNELLGTELPTGDFDSLGGLLLHLIGQIPAVGESIETNGIRLTAERVQGRRIRTVRVSKLGSGTAPVGSRTLEGAENLDEQ